MDVKKKIVTVIIAIIGTIAIIGSCYLRIQYICENAKPMYQTEVKAGSSNASKETE
jgi:hypothetical protein